ncbi:MAG: hypothetical protein ACKVJH_09720, partial [Flavobacteriales bacterium]
AFRYEKTHTVVDVGLVVLQPVGGYQLSSNDGLLAPFKSVLLPLLGQMEAVFEGPILRKAAHKLPDIKSSKNRE